MRRLAFAAAIVLLAAPARAEDAPADRQEGYYYPPVTSTEVFERQIADTPPANRTVRVTFTTQITKAQLAAPEAPQYVLFAKGSEAEKLIIVALEDDIFKTLYRARAVLAQLTSNARGTEFFVQNELQTEATFFDLLTILDFESLTISDGETWSHRVEFRPAAR